MHQVDYILLHLVCGRIVNRVLFFYYYLSKTNREGGADNDGPGGLVFISSMWICSHLGHLFICFEGLSCLFIE